MARAQIHLLPAARDYIRAQRGKHFDPGLAEAFPGISDKVLEVQRDLQDPAGDKGASV